MTVVFFEDYLFGNFEPLSLSHPAYSLLCGTSKIYYKWMRFFESCDYMFLSRPYLADSIALETGKAVNMLPDDKALFINGRFIPSEQLVQAVGALGDGEALISHDIIVAFRTGSDRPEKMKTGIENIFDRGFHDRLMSLLKTKEIDIDGPNYLWDLVNMNGPLVIEESSDFRKKPGRLDAFPDGVSVINRDDVFVHGSVRISPSTVIDASDGPVIIEKDVLVEPLSYIQGPCYIGPDCRIVGGKIREGSSFGPVCRIGGEVESSIMIGYCNKYHEGFLGHAYTGEWVNLGAMTTNSDLKNNYKPISVEIEGQPVDTGSIKIGCFIGDHTKTGIGTNLNTGINIGFSCNLYGGGLFADKSIPSFSWGTPGNLTTYRLEKATETAKASMARRNVKFATAHTRLFDGIFHLKN